MPVPLLTFNVPEARTTRAWVDRWSLAGLQRIPFVLTMAEALRRIEQRSNELPERFMKVAVSSEPQFTKRRVNAQSPRKPWSANDRFNGN